MAKELTDEEKAKHKYYNWKKHMGNYKQVDNNPVIISQKEFNLSEKIQDRKGNFPPYNTRFTCDIEDIKEFIKRLKKVIKKWHGFDEDTELERFIDKLAGDKLTKS